MKKLVLASALITAFGAAHAGAMDDGNLTIGGFGTLGEAKINTDKAQFIRYNQAEGVGEKARIGLDSNLGLQASYKVNDALSGTVQVLTRKNTSTSFTTDLTWAFLKYKINDELNVRVGRVVIPTFLISDYQNVGYANTMMRPPVEMYAQDPIESADGADFNYQHAFGDTNFTAQGLIGVSRGKLVLAGTTAVATYRAPVMGLSLAVEHGPVTLRAAHVEAKLSGNDAVPLNQLSATLTAVGFSGLANDLTFNNRKKVTFTEVGATLDWNNIVGQAEYGMRRAKEPVYIPDTNSWYAMVGYRVGKFLPYFSHAQVTQHGRSVTLPTGFPTSGPLAAVVGNLLQANLQSTNLVGVRWDFAKNVDAKFQVDRVKPGAKGGMLINGPVGGLKDNVTVVAASLDFVF
ncbi:porin [Duganella sp. LX20W]|uniref:Porin n=1 Tax=Rugamonas brunnea TaxID=2758569 RepID=A0A7W2IAF7_9BURK|nr:porin [Rugamonas brunnea]MBA5636386.1 porin [Rugamonas brunnea]